MEYGVSLTVLDLWSISRITIVIQILQFYNHVQENTDEAMKIVMQRG